jgi:hypothetical protein
LSFPAILGRDVSCVVRAVGANVKPFKPGATYAELVAVPDSDLPDGVDLVDAAAVPLIALTGPVGPPRSERLIPLTQVALEVVVRSEPRRCGGLALAVDDIAIGL